MKIAAVIFMTAVFGFFAFQNCQKAPAPDDQSKNNLSLSSNQVDLSELKLKEIELNIDEQETVVKNSNSYQIVVNKVFKIDLETGRFTVTSDLDSSANQYCLTETLTNELNSILKSSQICKTNSGDQQNNSGIVCAQVIKMAYANLIVEKETFNLGYATDSCGSNGVDLCGDQSALLKAYIASVKNHYKSFLCQ